MPAFLRTRVFVLVVLAAAVCPSTAAGGQEAPAPPAVSLERIQKHLEGPPPRLAADAMSHLPVATFRARVDGRTYMLTFQEQLHKDFDLTDFQRQWHEYAARCCGINLLSIARTIDRAVTRREERRIREQIALELAGVEAGAKPKK